MHCTECGVFVLPGWNACGGCQTVVPVGAHLVAPVRRTEGVPDPELRERVLTFLLDDLTSAGLSEWCRELEIDARGTVEEKRKRIREQSEFLSAPPRMMIARAMLELRDMSVGALEGLCYDLGLSGAGTKQVLLRRIHHHLAKQECLLPARTHAGHYPTPQEIYPFLAWYPVYDAKRLERDLYDDFLHTMTHIFGDALVHKQVPVAHGTRLSIDFHIGSTAPGQGGVGIEIKRPTSNSEVQRAIGQLTQYKDRYGHALIVVVTTFPDGLEQKQLQPLFHALSSQGIAHIAKRLYWAEALE